MNINLNLLEDELIFKREKRKKCKKYECLWYKQVPICHCLVQSVRCSAASGEVCVLWKRCCDGDGYRDGGGDRMAGWRRSCLQGCNWFWHRLCEDWFAVAVRQRAVCKMNVSPTGESSTWLSLLFPTAVGVCEGRRLTDWLVGCSNWFNPKQENTRSNQKMDLCRLMQGDYLFNLLY